jgi:hypothetical protein
MKPLGTIARAVAERMSGGKPSALRATVTAVAAGGIVAVNVYRGLRSD